MTSHLEKFLAAQDAKMRSRLKEKLLELKRDPFGMKNVKAMKAWGPQVYRFRLGDIRVIYRVGSSSHVEILDIDYRGSIY